MVEGFNAVAWMRRRRAQIDEEDKDLTWKEKSEKTRRLLQGDALWEYLKGRLVEPRTLVPPGTPTRDRP